MTLWGIGLPGKLANRSVMSLWSVDGERMQFAFLDPTSLAGEAGGKQGGQIVIISNITVSISDQI